MNENVRHRTIAETVWHNRNSVLSLQTNDVHVWRASLETGKQQHQMYERILSGEERERASRFHFEKDRIRFIVTRGILRSLLSDYLTIDAGKVSFVYGPYGRPELSAGLSSVPIRFNASHSHGLALFAFTLNRDIGVDIEYILRDISIDDIAGRFFLPNEKSALDMLPSNMKKKAFFACWTRKEAFLKATGKGLSFGLGRVEVPMNPESPASLLSIGGSKEDATLWSLHDIAAAPDYAAAIAVKGHGCNICLQEWTCNGNPNQINARTVE